MAAGNFRAQRYRPEYKMPAIDSARAKANAVLFLCGARSIDHLTAEGLAHQYRLKPKTAEYLLLMEKKRRAENAL